MYGLFSPFSLFDLYLFHSSWPELIVPFPDIAQQSLLCPKKHHFSPLLITPTVYPPSYPPTTTTTTTTPSNGVTPLYPPTTTTTAATTKLTSLQSQSAPPLGSLGPLRSRQLLQYCPVTHVRQLRWDRRAVPPRLQATKFLETSPHSIVHPLLFPPPTPQSMMCHQTLCSLLACGACCIWMT